MAIVKYCTEEFKGKIIILSDVPKVKIKLYPGSNTIDNEIWKKYKNKGAIKGLIKSKKLIVIAEENIQIKKTPVEKMIEEEILIESEKEEKKTTVKKKEKKDNG